MFQPPGIHVQWVNDEAVVLNEDTSELHYLNPQSALMYALVLEYGMPEAVTKACERMEGPADQITDEMNKVVGSFIEKGLLAEVPD
jgi:hypothetical protein